MEVENILAKHNFSFILKNTDILLFKTMLQDHLLKLNFFKKQYTYLLSKKYNNIDKITKKNIKLVKLKNASHETILSQENILVSHILNFTK